jgi:hypothetical protein
MAIYELFFILLSIAILVNFIYFRNKYGSFSVKESDQITSYRAFSEVLFYLMILTMSVAYIPWNYQLF